MIDNNENSNKENTSSKLKHHYIMKNTIKYLSSSYQLCLTTHEIPTKCLTSGIIALLGDYLAQCFEFSTKIESNSISSNGVSSSNILVINNMGFHLDRIRLYGIFVEAAFFASPVMHYAYNYMEYLVPIHKSSNSNDSTSSNINNSNGHRNGKSKYVALPMVCTRKKKKAIIILSKWAAALFHVWADVFILGPFFVLTMMFFTSITEGKISTFGSELMNDFWPTLEVSIIASLAFVPVQLLAFKYFQLKYRILYMNVQDIVWNAVVSFMAHKSRKQSI